MVYIWKHSIVEKIVYVFIYVCNMLIKYDCMCLGKTDEFQTQLVVISGMWD